MIAFPERERDRDGERKREQRAAAKDVVVPPPEDLERRLAFEQDDEAWLLYYFGRDSGAADPFWYAFTSQQREMIAAIRQAILHGGDQALAASRGEGKTTICERLLLKYTLQGVVGFSVLFAATGSAAANSLESIKLAIEENPLLLADYPEVCVPVQALENTPNRAHYMTVTGTRMDNGEAYTRQPAKFTWCGQEIVFPNVPGAPAARAIIATRGLDAAVRGLKKKGRRPHVAVIDDPDTEETARSEEQAKKLEDRIDKAIAGLGGQQRTIARVMLTTLQNRTCVSYRFTDPTQKPSWQGRRFRFLVKPPERADLWEEYVQMRINDWANGTDLATEFYLERREQMDAGAEVANPNRFTSSQVSSLQFYFDQVARIGAEAVATEYDNDPPEESGPIESGITPHRVQRQLSGYPRCVVPPDCVVLTQGIDCQKLGLYWVVRAWRSDGTGFVIDYNFTPTFGTTYGSDEGVDRAIYRAILAHMEFIRQDRYYSPRGEVLPISLTVVDAGYMTNAVYQACKDVGLGILPGMGYGKSGGCARPNFTPGREQRDGFIPGDGWNVVEVNRNEWPGLWRVDMDADRWKTWEHDRWMTDPSKPGTMLLFGEKGDNPKRLSQDEKDHMTYAKHITAEVETEEFVRGVLVRKWTNKHGRPNHYFDASYMSCVAANIKGVRLLRQATSAPTKPKPAPVVSVPTGDTPFLASAR